MRRLVGLSILPPMAVARLGGSAEPLDSFEWVKSRDAFGGTQTTISPTVSLRVDSGNGSLTAHIPNEIRFRDDGKLRPVAPFFELWVQTQSDLNGSCSEQPLTLRLLRECGLSLDNLWFRVTAANRKAQRRTGSASCAFVARVEVHGNDHALKHLNAISPATSGQEPLVRASHPIYLGAFRVLKPSNEQQHGVDLSVVRLRYTPASGQVYGPPHAVSGPASPLRPGLALAPASQEGRIHEIVPFANRILSQNTPWTQYILETGQWPDPQPSDSYDGANVGDSKSWGIVDDTCDVLIEATLVAGVRRLEATARVFTGPPDYAPDRRPFYSIVDDLEDRVDDDSGAGEVPAAEIVALFRRIFETAGLINLDAIRARALNENREDLASPGVTPLSESDLKPHVDEASMTSLDLPYVDKLPPLLQAAKSSAFSESVPNDPLPYAKVAAFVHGPLSDEAVLLEFLRLRGAHVKEVVRPPFGNWSEFTSTIPESSNPVRRDPRVLRDTLYDMRMPPYMRDANAFPLSMTRRQYRRLLSFLDYLENADA